MVQSSLARHLTDPWTSWLTKALSRSSRRGLDLKRLSRELEENPGLRERSFSTLRARSLGVSTFIRQKCKACPFDEFKSTSRVITRAWGLLLSSKDRMGWVSWMLVRSLLSYSISTAVFVTTIFWQESRRHQMDTPTSLKPTRFLILRLTQAVLHSVIRHAFIPDTETKGSGAGWDVPVSPLP
jgi:hypothetical protein